MEDGIIGSAIEGDLSARQRAWHLPSPRLGQWSRWTFACAGALAALWIAGTAARFYVRDYYIFVPDYVRWMLTSAAEPAPGAPTHVFLIFVDHFEPNYDYDAVVRWSARYRALASRHHDADCRAPQHTWFYPGEQEDRAILDLLRELAAGGFGEVELHYHHDHDTYDTLKAALQVAIDTFQTRGFLRTVDGKTRFAFVHGNWSLDNSEGPEMCGVDEEIRLLRELGCYVDFTFPSIYTAAQPPFVNAIYAAKDDPGPRSYARRYPLSALADGRADLMLFEGPLIFTPSRSVRHLFLDLDDGNIHGAIPASPERADAWVRADVHVDGRPDWRFIKLFTHGVTEPEDEEAVVGPTMDRTLTYLEHAYNDGHQYVLHYITAREAYNLAMAAAARLTGPPEQYYDYLIKPYAADKPWHPLMSAAGR